MTQRTPIGARVSESKTTRSAYSTGERFSSKKWLAWLESGLRQLA
jgi:hypothetical protein